MWSPRLLRGPLSWVWSGSSAAEILNRRSQLQCKTMEPLKKHEWVNFFLWALFFSQHLKSWVRNLILQNIWWWVHLFFSHQSHLARCGRVLVQDNCGRQWQREFCYSPNWSGRPRVALVKTSSHENFSLSSHFCPHAMPLCSHGTKRDGAFVWREMRTYHNNS